MGCEGVRVGWEKCLGGIHRGYKCLEEGRGEVRGVVKRWV